MRPETSQPRHRDGTRRPATRAGVAHRPEGQALALRRAASYRGFTQAVPNLDRLRALLPAVARRRGIGAAAAQTLTAMLDLLPAARWQAPGGPRLQASNQRIADEVGCDPRSVQRHLGQVHGKGLVAIDWGPGNTRLPCRQDGRAGAGPVGIDLRPLLVFTQEAVAFLQAIKAVLRAFHAAKNRASGVLLTSRGGAGARADLPTATARLERLAELRRQLRAASRLAHRPTATVAAIEAATATVGAIAAEAETLRQALDPAPDPPGSAGDGSSGASPVHEESVHQKTASTPVENHVRTIQGSGRTPAKGWDGEGEPDDPAGPLLYGRWLAAYQGTRPLPSDEQVELEITARLRARAMGLATRVVNQAVERHGLGLVVGAVLFVHALPEAARVRCKGGLLASLLRRDAGRLTPATFHRRPPADPDLGEAEALGIAAHRAPSHQPRWVLGRWHATRQRKREPIRDQRGCLAAFAAKLEREQGHRRWAA